MTGVADASAAGEPPEIGRRRLKSTGSGAGRRRARKPFRWEVGRYSKSVARSLFDFYSRTREHFGYVKVWWPGTPWEQTLSAILVQQCQWREAWRGILRLKDDRLLDWSRLAKADPERVRHCLRSVTLNRQKTERVIGLAQWFDGLGVRSLEEFFASGTTEALRKQLLARKGVGDETADAILLYASNHHPKFIVDAFTRRVFSRVGFVPGISAEQWRTLKYRELQDLFERHLTESMTWYWELEWQDDLPLGTQLYRDYHAQIAELAKHHCLKSRPRCRRQGTTGWKDLDACPTHCRDGECTACPLVRRCRYAKANRDGAGS